MKSDRSSRELFYELAYYTLSHPDPVFIHQYAVDAFTAQTADENTKPIAITFALIGLYLHVEKNYTGKEVQQAHIRLAATRKPWPSFDLPKERGGITVQDVLSVPPGDARDQMIQKWCASVWEAYHDCRASVIELWDNYRDFTARVRRST